MAPEPSILKRKRSRPSEWWAAAPTSNATEAPPQQDEPPPKKRGRPSISSAERMVQEAPAAGNRGKRRKSVNQEDTENAEDGEGGVVGKTAKPLRRGRPSNTEAELLVATEPVAEIEGTNKKKRGRPAQRVEEEDGAMPKPVRLGRPSNTEAEVKAVADAGTEKDVARKEKRDRSGQRREEIVETIAKPLRRGRSSNTEAELVAAREEAAADADDDELGGEPVKTDTQSKKNRGRPAASRERDVLISDAVGAPIVPKKRGRRPKASDEVAAATENSLVEGNKATKPPGRGRPSNTEAEVQTAVESSTKEQHVQKKRGKLAKVDAQPSTAVTKLAEAEVSKKHTRQSDAELEEPTPSGSVTKDVVGRASRGRRSGTVIEIEAATSSLARDRNVGKNGDSNSKTTKVKDRKGPSISQEPSKAKRKSQPHTADIHKSSEIKPHGKKPKHREVEEMNEERPESKRRRVKPESQEGPAQTEKPPTYQHLAAVTRRVSRQAIETKWEPLLPGCIERISQLLQDLQRPVVVTLNDERKKTDANKVMQMVSRRLISKISKGLPFPPGTHSHREDEFDFEKILDHCKTLESQLTPALHSNELLESEVAKEKALLESEEEALTELETNAKTEASMRKEAGRKLHSLLLSNKSKVETDAINDHIGLREDYRILSFTHAEDEDLEDIAKELSGHLETIQGNMSRVEGVSKAMTKSRAAVQATLFDRLETNQYEDTVLG